MLRENTGFCVGVRHPHSRGAKVVLGGYDRWHTPLLPHSKEHEYGWAVGGTAALHCHGGVGVWGAEGG